MSRVVISELANSALGTLEERKDSERRGFKVLLSVLCTHEIPADICIICSATFKKDSNALEHCQKTGNRFLEGLETFS